MAKQLAETMGWAHHPLETRRFPDTEGYIRIPSETIDALRDEPVVLVSNTFPDSGIVETLLMLDAIQDVRAGRLQNLREIGPQTLPDVGKGVILAVPYFGYSRQDKRFKPGESISARAIANMMATQCDGMVLLDDTPYIDVTDLDRVHDAYRRFSSIPTLSETLKSIPFWGTWDDHDFGRNDSDGTLPGKEHSRTGFVHYRPNATFGQNDEGIYTKFRYGPVEVFLLDTRWFSRTEPSWADPEKPTLLGKAQWEWLKQGLLASDAPFKLLACGMIWDDKKNGESDDWGTYMHERQALQDWLGQERIKGVILIGGDIHVSRLLQYETVEQVGYPLYQFIVSPMHGSVIPSLNVPHPALLESAEEPHVFLKLHADTTVSPATLEATWMNREGKVIFNIQLDRDQLSRAK